MDKNGNLTTVVERTKIKRDDDGIFYYENDERFKLEENTPVSMNFWGLKPNVFKYLNEGLKEFLAQHGNELKSEYYIPVLINDNIVKGIISTKVLQCDSPWFGVTYKEDKPIVQHRIKELIESGDYPNDLWIQKINRFYKTKHSFSFFKTTSLSFKNHEQSTIFKINRVI